ncbi:DNA N-glycosylase and apurinic/apyrimidinic (AP) lyase [Boothiomyces macroporosus]|uniref:Endonuclease III homolog n=1 Tax=Boothiomyces macroporosus TaxID=261099 RepID=A0AAD5Y497_9FUNG|nr:DNA N-glycosylase and apurinic/apyrimidinic (AP) lyase [Boothiomyces macroporosus]
MKRVARTRAALNKQIKLDPEEIKIKKEFDVPSVKVESPTALELNENVSVKMESIKSEFTTVKEEPIDLNYSDSISKKPNNWEQVYQLIKEFRKENKADVDTVGCAKLFDESEPEQIKRYQILTSLQLSSQTKDPITAQAVANLKQAGLNPSNIAKMDPIELNKLISKVGYHNKKTVYLQKTANILLEKYNGDVPNNLKEMLDLPGVGPKMAYLAMQECWNLVEGIGVDTHVHRICNRLGWVKSKAPEQTRAQLQDWLDKKYWSEVNVLLVGYGQVLCKPVNPMCGSCPVAHLCPKIGSRKGKNVDW